LWGRGTLVRGGPLYNGDGKMGIVEDERDEKKARARQKRAEKPKSGVTTDFRGFVNVDLSKEDKEGLADWLGSSDMWVKIDEVVRSGCRISVKPDPSGNACIASVNQTDPESANCGYVVTARAANGAEALCRIVYIVDEVLGAVWTERGRVSDPDRW